MDCRRIDERIEAWLDGELGERERLEMARHLDECPRCRAEYAALLAAVDRLETVIDPVAPEDFVVSVTARLPEREPAASPARVAWVLGLAGVLGTAASALMVLWFMGLAVPWGGLAAAVSALPGLAMGAAGGAMVLGEALAGPVARALALNVALVIALGLAYLWRTRLAQSGAYVAA